MAAPLHLGLIGAGRWGQVYIRTLRSLAERCRLTHLCTSQPGQARLVPHPVTVVPDWRALIASPCDAVLIATPPATHAEIVEACLAAGKPCLVEKPLCLDVPTAQRLRDRIRTSGVPVLVNHTHLFSPAYRTLKRTVASSGEPVRVILSEGMGFGPFRTHTSALWDWGPHDVSLCLDLLGVRPHRVEALGGPCGPDGEPEMISARLEFPGEACAWIHVGRLAPQKRRRVCVLTETRLYVWDDMSPDTLTVSSVAFTRRYVEGMPEPLDAAVLGTSSELPTMVHVLSCFLDGLAGGDTSRFGAGLAHDVTCVLAACEDALRRTRGPWHAVS